PLGTNTPMRVGALTNVTAVAAGYSHSMALLADGTILTWGNNEYGEWGNGTTFTVTSPTTAVGLNLLNLPSAPLITVSSPPDLFATNATSLSVTAIYSNLNGFVGTVLLQRDGNQVASYENPGGVTNGSHTFTLDTSSLADGTNSYHAIAFGGAN